MIEAHFTHIKSELIQKIAASSNNILIAVAWFTNRDLFNAILAALDRGVSVSLLLIDDMINRNEYNLDFNVYINKRGKLRFVNTRKSLMHNKFCVFDSSITITGSYNWTYAAETRNYENIIVTDDRDICKAFQAHFENLWEQESTESTFSQIKLSSCQDKEFLREYEELEEEFGAMVANNIISNDELTTLQTRKRNIAVISIASLTTVHNRKDPRLRMNIGKDCRVNGVDGKVLNIIPGGHKLPFTNTVGTQTKYDNQTSVTCTIRFGNEEEASMNKEVVRIKLDNLPPMKAGKVKFKTKVTIDTNGYLHVEFLCTNTGIAKETVYINPGLVEYR